MELLGWIGSIAFALCGIPFAWDAWRKKRVDMSLAGVLLWFVGEVLTLIYVVYHGHWPLIFNYGVNAVCLLVVLRYSFTGKSNPKESQ